MSDKSPVPPGGRERAQPESFRASALQTSFTVNDIQKSLAWYRDILGFIVDEKYEREGRLQAVALKAGAVRVLIGQDDFVKGKDRKKGQGMSVQFTTTQDIDALAAQIEKRGAKLESPPEDRYGMRSFSVKDPDGFRFVISSPRVRS
jgi:uncharacterized glyoxalase superfamily protein PhnB